MYAYKHTNLHTCAQKTSYANKGSKTSVHLYVSKKLISYELKLHSILKNLAQRPPKQVIGSQMPGNHLPNILASKKATYISRDREFMS